MQVGDDHTYTEGFLVHWPRAKLNGVFAQQLDVELIVEGHIKIENTP